MICTSCNRDIPQDGDGRLLRHKKSKNGNTVCEMSGPETCAPKKLRIKRPAVPLVCPTHGMALLGHKTSFGRRFKCPIKNCTVAAWSGTTSTPADADTRAARIAAHDSFDPFWKRAGWSRKSMYVHLATYLGIDVKRCHIGMFNAEQCEKVVEFCRTFRLEPVAAADGGEGKP